MRRIELPYQPWQGCVLPLNYICNKWRSRWDSNPRSPPWQGGMLTTTPPEQYRCFGARTVMWRRRRDLNPRAAFATYALSRGTYSASWVLLHLVTHSAFIYYHEEVHLTSLFLKKFEKNKKSRDCPNRTLLPDLRRIRNSVNFKAVGSI